MAKSTVLGLALALLTGCGGDAPFDIVRVSGKVTYEDGSIIPGDIVMLTFYPRVDPIDAKTHPKPAETEISTKDGTFSQMTTWKYGDGAIVGRHKVTVSSMSIGAGPTGAVPAIYADPLATPLEVEVTGRGGPIVLTIKRPNDN